MLIKKLKIAELKPAEYNPRQSSKEQEAHLKASLTKFGVVEPIIVNTNPDRNNIIIGGHFRVRELKKMGEKEVDCVLLNLSLEDEKELNIRLNSNTGGWDFDTLANNFDLEDLTTWGLDVAEFGIEAEADLPDLATGDKEPFEQITFTLATEQASLIKELLDEVKKSDAYKYTEVFGNENGNGNALYTIFTQWEGSRK